MVLKWQLWKIIQEQLLHNTLLFCLANTLKISQEMKDMHWHRLSLCSNSRRWRKDERKQGFSFHSKQWMQSLKIQHELQCVLFPVPFLQASISKSSKEPYHAHSLFFPPPHPNLSLLHLPTTQTGRELDKAIFYLLHSELQVWEWKQSESPHTWNEIQSPPSAPFLSLQAPHPQRVYSNPLVLLMGILGFRPTAAPLWNISK